MAPARDLKKQDASLSLLGIVAHVTSNGRDLPVHKVEVTERRVECFIESQTDQEFQVSLSFEAYIGSDTVARVFLDGQRMVGQIVESRHRSCRIAGRVVGPGLEAPFKFGKIALTDVAEEACSDEAIIKEVGSIRLTVHRVVLGGILPRDYGAETTQKHKFDEQSKKAELAHVAELGAARSVATSSYSQHVDYIDPVSAPLVEFVWKYRCKDLLEVKGIIPTPEPAPAPVTGKRPLQEANANEREEMARLRAENERLREQLRGSKKVKQEKGVGKKQKKVIDLD